MNRTQINGIIFSLLLIVLGLFVLPRSASAQVAYNVTAVPSCPNAGDVPTVDTMVRYAFWPCPSGTVGNCPQWSDTSYSRGSKTITGLKTNANYSGFYVGMWSGHGAYLPGKSAIPSTGIDVAWIGWTTQVPMIRMPLTAYPNGGTFTYYYSVPAQYCATPTYALTVTNPPAGQTFQPGQTVTVQWNFTYANQPTNPPSSVQTNVYLQNGTGLVSPKVLVSSAATTRYGSNSISVTIPSNTAPGSSYRWYVATANTLSLRSGATSASSASDETDSAFNVVLPTPTPIPKPIALNASCVGTTITFNWPAVSGITEYYWRLSDLTTGAYYNNDSVKTNSYSFAYALPGHSYRAWIHSKVPTLPTPNWGDPVYAEFSCPPGPSPTPIPTATRTPTPSPTLTPTPSPTPVGFCQSNTDCTAGNVCIQNGATKGCVPMSPTPSPTATPTPTPNVTNTPMPSPTPNCSLRPKGDANCDCTVDSADRAIWRKEYLGEIPQERADFDGEANCKDDSGNPQYVCTYDAQIWLDNLQLGTKCAGPTSAPTTAQPSATAGPTVPQSTATTAPSSTAAPSATPTRTPTPTVPQSTVAPSVTPNPMSANNYLEIRTRFVTDELANLSNGSTSNVTVKSAVSTMFSDGCLGCATAGMMCTQVITPGTRVVVYAPYNQGTGQCIFRVYHYGRNATTGAGACSPSSGRTIAACTADPFPPPSNSAQ